MSDMTPARFARPYLTDGRASQNAETAVAPLDVHVPDPDDYQRPALTDGHARPAALSDDTPDAA
jgi:hypothetical protein